MGDKGPRLIIVPIGLRGANEFVSVHHRHHKRVAGMKFAVGVTVQGSGPLNGVAIVGRPVSRHQDDGWTLEVNRCCTDGTTNAVSCLYGAAWRVTRELGYRRLITYTLPEEGGGSLRASGWSLVGLAGGGNWNSRSRPRADSLLQQKKLLWEKKV